MPLISNLLSKDLPDKFYRFQFQIYSGLFAIGILGFLYLSSPIVSRQTYLSENALSPGLVSSDLYISTDKTRQLTAQLRNGFKNKNISDVIQSILIEHGIEAFKQSLHSNQTTEQNEENVYGIVRAPRTASTESIILVAPLQVQNDRESDDKSKANLYGIIHTLSIGLALHRKPYMSKDVILLFPASKEYGTRVWLDAYYNTDPNALPLDAHAGSIQAGLALELSDEKFYSIDLRHNGINGQLANLDLINTLVQLCEKNSMATSLYSVYIDLNDREILVDYLLGSLRTLLLNVLTLATGVPDGVHGQFLHYRIEMITLSGSQKKFFIHQNSPINPRAIDDVIEGFIRSLNNLLERFHQSFFFYLHLNHRTFVSIATYMVPLGIIVLPGLIRSLALYMTFFKVENDKKNKYIIYGRTMNFQVDYWPIVREALECITLCYILTWFQLNLLVLIGAQLTMYISPLILGRFRSNIVQFDYFQFLLLLSGCAILGCLSLLNYSLALLISIFLMPCYFFAGIVKLNHWIIRLFSNLAFIFIFNPLTFIFVYYYSTICLRAGSIRLIDFKQFSTDIDDYIASYHLFNAWTVDVLSLVIAPLWLLLYRSTFWSHF